MTLEFEVTLTWQEPEPTFTKARAGGATMSMATSCVVTKRQISLLLALAMKGVYPTKKDAIPPRQDPKCVVLKPQLAMGRPT